MQRQGRREELLKGPVLYGLVHAAITARLWRSSPAAVAAIMVLSFGDGCAELAGKALGRTRLPHSPQKVGGWVRGCRTL